MTTITVTEIVAAIEAATADAPDPEGAFTVAELCRMAGWSEKSARDNLRALLATGGLEVFRVKRQDLSGRVQLVPGYRIVRRAA